MRKRERSMSASPVLRVTPAPTEEQTREFQLRQQVLFDVLRRTSLAEQKDREIVEWLADTAELLQGIENEKFGAGSLAELRFLVLGVLHTMPWWRVVETVDPRHVHIALRGGRRGATRAITRWHLRIQLAFERVCMVLVGQSPHAVRGVLEVAMRPFQMRPPVDDGALRLLPGDSIMRIMNTVATTYSGGVVLDVLEQCMRTLVPKRRWAEQRHHTACIALLLHLAMEAHIPQFPTCDYGQGSLHGNGMANAALHQSPRELSLRCSEESGTDAGNSSTSHQYHQLHPLEMTAPMMSASEADFSDASTGMASPSPASGHPFPTRFRDFTMQNNKMLAYRDELIRFVLHQLLDMELSLQNHDVEPMQEGASLSNSFSCSGLTDSSQSIPCSPLGRPPERSAEKVFVEILRRCTGLVFHRLAEDLVRQQAAGVCGNAEWWREILAFHLTFVLKVERPVCLLYLAPSLALLGGEEEAIDMMHKLVSLVTKGYQPVQQKSTWRAAAAGPARVRMAPPSVGPLMIPMAHRVRAAFYIYPLFCFTRERIGSGEGTRKRLQKWVLQELKGNASSSSSSSSPTFLVQVLFAQCAAMSELVGADLVEEMKVHASDTDALQSLMNKYMLPQFVEGVEEAAMSDTSSSSHFAPAVADTACRGRFDLAKMESAGLLNPRLMDNCPWDWRRCQSGKGLEH